MRRWPGWLSEGMPPLDPAAHGVAERCGFSLGSVSVSPCLSRPLTVLIGEPPCRSLFFTPSSKFAPDVVSRETLPRMSLE